MLLMQSQQPFTIKYCLETCLVICGASKNNRSRGINSRDDVFSAAKEMRQLLKDVRNGTNGERFRYFKLYRVQGAHSSRTF